MTAPKPGSGARMTAQEVMEHDGYVVMISADELKVGAVETFDEGELAGVAVHIVGEASREDAIRQVRMRGSHRLPWLYPAEVWRFYRAVAG